MKVWEDITEVPLPLPFELKIIKAYVIRGNKGITIIDTGLKTEDSLRAWDLVQKRDGWCWQDVHQIVLTHYHPDHYGLSGTLQEWSGAPVFISKKDYEQAQLFFGKETKLPEMLADYFYNHGLVDELTSKIPKLLRSYGGWVEPHPTPTFIQEGDIVCFGDREYVVYHTPGHADGHLSFLDQERGWLLGGDFLLPRITPNISLWPGCNTNPLKTYLETLTKMEHLPVKRVFPSHGSVFDTYRERIEQLRSHHDQRLNCMREFLHGEKRATGYDVCKHIFGTSLSIHNLRFALSETLAHLEYMRMEGDLEVEKTEGVNYYSHVN